MIWYVVKVLYMYSFTSVKNELKYVNLFAISWWRRSLKIISPVFICSNDCSYFKIFIFSHRMKTNTEMVCLRNFKRCRPPDWSIVDLLKSFFFIIVSINIWSILFWSCVDLCSLLNKYSLCQIPLSLLKLFEFTFFCNFSCMS